MELVNGKTFDEYVAGERPTLAPDVPACRPLPAASCATSRSRSASARSAASIRSRARRATSNACAVRCASWSKRVAALHDAGKLHRDSKPSNVLVTPEGRVVVLDFGLVSSSTLVDPEQQDAERTVGGCVFGTPAYMSPEQAAGEAVGHRQRLVRDRHDALRSADRPAAVRRQRARDPAPEGRDRSRSRRSELVHGIPDDLDQLCRELLRRDPERRPSSAEILRYLTGHSEPPVIFDAQSSTRDSANTASCSSAASAT